MVSDRKSKNGLIIALLISILVLVGILCFALPRIMSQSGEPPKDEYTIEDAQRDTALEIEQSQVRSVEILLGLAKAEYSVYPNDLETLAEWYAGYTEPTEVDDFTYTKTSDGYVLSYRSRITGQVVTLRP